MFSNQERRDPTHRLRSPAGVSWVAEAATRSEWAEVLAAAREPVHHQLPQWLDALVAVHGGRDATRVYRDQDGRRLILPLVAHGPTTRLTRYRAFPYGWGNPGLLAGADTPVTADDTRAVFDDLAELGGVHVGIRTWLDDQAAWQAGCPAAFESIDHTTHTVDISQGFDHFWDTTLGSSTRTKVRKGEKLGVEVTSGSAGALLPEFYTIYQEWTVERGKDRWMPDALSVVLARRRNPLRKLDLVASALGPDFVVWVASFEGRAVAANIQLFSGAHSTYWRGFSHRREGGRTRATYLLQRRMIEEACRRGCRWHHMGESGGVASLVQFKTTFGAQARTYREFYRERVPYMKAGRTLDSVRSRLEDRLVRSKRTR